MQLPKRPEFPVAIALLLVQAALFFYHQHSISTLAAPPGSRELGADASNFQVYSIPPGAKVFTTAGRELGSTPCTLQAVENEREFLLRAPGYLDYPATKEKLANPVVLECSWPLWLLLHLPGLAGLAMLGIGLRRQAVHQDETARQVTTRLIRDGVVGPGARVGPYTLGVRLGAGAMADVYLADNPEPGKGGTRVAVKVLSEKVCQNQNTRDRFRREAQICQQLDHPGIVSVMGSGEHPGSGRLWMSQEFVDGKSLDQTPLPLPWREVVELLIPLCEALEYAHRSGIVHRDLKPANILLTSDGRPVISDFGLAQARNYETITKTDMTLGTPAYMPPEQLNQKRVDGRADLYSLGCIAFQLLSGRVPFEQEDVVALLMAHLTQQPPSLASLVADLPPTLGELVDRLLVKDPEERFASASELLAPLRALQKRA